MLKAMAGLLIFIGIGIIVSTVLRWQARKARRDRQRPPGDRLDELRRRYQKRDRED